MTQELRQFLLANTYQQVMPESGDWIEVNVNNVDASAPASWWLRNVMSIRDAPVSF